MKYFAAILFLFSGASNFCLRPVLAQQTEISRYNSESEADHDLQREQWINQMHRAAPGTDPRAMDIAARETKIAAYEAARHKKSGFEILSIPQDTIAGGRLAGYWSERGSSNVCGRMHTADIDFDNNIVYAASAYGNVWKASFGNSTAWTSLNDQHRFGDIRMLRVITTSKGKRIIAAASGPASVYYSDDGGATWLSSSGLGGPKNWGGFKRGVITADEQTMYVFGNEWDYSKSRGVSTLYRSTDEGKSFKNIRTWDYDENKCDVWVSRDAAGAAYFLKGDSLFSIGSTGALTFMSLLTYTTDIGNVGSLILTGSAKNNVTTLGVMESTGGTSYIWTSTNGGFNWSQTGTFGANPYNANSFKILASNPKVMATGTNNPFFSTNGGTDWTLINDWAEYYGHEKDKLHADIDGIDFIKDPTGKEYELYSTDGGIFLSADGMQTFENITLTGIGTSQYYSVLTSRQSPYYIYSGAQDQGYQRAQDNAGGPLGMSQTISGDYGHLTSSNNGKSTWCDYPGFAMLYANAETSTQNAEWKFTGTNALWMPPITSDPVNPLAAYIASGGSGSESFIYHLISSGGNVTATPLAFDFSGGNGNRNVSAIAFSPLDNTRMYAATNDGEFFYSANTGQTWTQPNVKAPGGHYFYGSVILPSTKAKGTLWIAGSGYSNPAVYISTDYGQTFTAMNSGLPNTLVYSLAATDDEKFLFAATDIGPYVYSVADDKWYDMSNAHAPDMVYWSVDYIPAIKTVRFGTYGRGVWDFVIGQAPILRNYTITAPKTGDILTGGTANYIVKFTSQNPGTAQKFEFSLDGGVTWKTLIGTAGASTFTWTQVPDTGSTKAMIRISDELGTIGKSGLFTIKKSTPAPQILTLTLGGLTNNKIASGANMNISWTTNGSSFGTGFTVEYSTDSLASWHLVRAVAATVKQTTWTTPTGYSPHSFIRVHGTDADKVSIEKQSNEFIIGSPQGVSGDGNTFDISLYPNPLSNITTFRYTLSEAGMVTLSVFDLMGKEVAKVISSEMQSAGMHSADFDALKLSSGSYTYLFSAGAKKFAGRMEVVK